MLCSALHKRRRRVCFADVHAQLWVEAVFFIEEKVFKLSSFGLQDRHTPTFAIFLLRSSEISVNKNSIFLCMDATLWRRNYWRRRHPALNRRLRARFIFATVRRPKHDARMSGGLYAKMALLSADFRCIRTCDAAAPSFLPSSRFLIGRSRIGSYCRD